MNNTIMDNTAMDGTTIDGFPSSHLSLPQSPIALYPRYITSEAETLTVSGRHFKPHTFTVTTASGEPLLRVKRDYFSFTHRKHVYDVDDNKLFTIRRQVIRCGRPFFYIASSSSYMHLFTLRTAVPGPTLNTSEATFVNTSTRQQERLLMQASWWNSSAKIRAQSDGRVIAQIDRKWWKLRRTYIVTIAPRVDKALIVAVCICLDDREILDYNISFGDS